MNQILILNSKRSSKIKVAVYTKYVPPQVLKIHELTAAELEENQILVKMNKSSMTYGYYRLRTTNSFSESVFGSTYILPKTYGEFILLDRDYITLKSAKIDGYILAFPLVRALVEKYFLNQFSGLNRKIIMIYVIAAWIDNFSIPLAEIIGANVSAISSKSKYETLKRICADYVNDYRDKDFNEIKNKFDYLFEALGLVQNKLINKILNKDGIIVTISLNIGVMVYKLFNCSKTKIRVTTQTKDNSEIIFKYLKRSFIKPFFERQFNLDNIKHVHNFMAKDSKLGNFIININ